MKSLPGSMHENVEITAGNTPRSGQVFDIFRQFPFLEQLTKYIRSQGPLEALAINRTLRVRELAMLEAELKNQSILTPSLQGIAGCFSHRASLDAGTWRWRARRMRVKAIPVRIDVARYLIAWSEELIASLSAHNFVLNHPAHRGENQPVTADRRDIMAKLAYLNQFAAYLLGSASSDQLPYGRGLQALLRVIATGQEMAPSGEDLKEEETPVLLLPTTRAEFQIVLRSCLDGSAEK